VIMLKPALPIGFDEQRQRL